MSCVLNILPKFETKDFSWLPSDPQYLIGALNPSEVEFT